MDLPHSHTMSGLALRSYGQMLKWVPPAARQAIEELRALTVDCTTRTALDRLTTHLVMKTEVWEKLPPDPKGVEGDVIRYAIFALVRCPRLRPRPKTGKKAAWDHWAEHLYKHPPGLSFENYAYFAAQLRDAIGSIPIGLWARHSATNPVQAISVLDAVARCFLSIAREEQELLAGLPQPARWDDWTPERLFSEFMSRKLEEIYGQPCDPVVAALTAVAFDRQNVSAETVRWRRRTDRRN